MELGLLVSGMERANDWRVPGIKRGLIRPVYEKLARLVHRGDGKRFVVRADEKLTVFIELESAI
jgi:hypothetical protein